MITNGPLDLSKLDKAYTCVVQLQTQPQGIIHQVTLRPDKIKDNLIRLGETKGDEAAGWQFPNVIQIQSILGTAIISKDGEVTVEPLVKEAKHAKHL